MLVQGVVPADRIAIEHTEQYVMWLHWEGNSYADAEAGRVTLTDWDDHRPRVRPVGVMMWVE